MMATSTAFNATNHGLQIGNNSGSITAEFHVARAYTTEDIDRICLHALRCPDSLAVKNRLKESKDRLVHQSIQWILEDPQYKDWANGDEVGLLWIKGGAGKGKTMLSIGLIEQLARAQAQDESTVVIYSFCQNADYELNTLEAILKGLILQLANQQPELKESLRRRWDTIQESFSEDVTSWQSLWNILFEMLARCKYSRVYMVVDALDECQDDDVVDFLKSIVRKGLDHPGKIKWMLTSRPWDGAERVLLAGQDQVQISLDGEHNSQSVSGAVEAYIASKVEELSRQHKYGATLKSEIETELTERSEGTFLWVSLVCKALESVCRDDALSTVQSLPPGLHPFYGRVLNQLNQGELAEVQKCMRLLKAMMTVYRPLKVAEVASVIGLTDDEDTIRGLVDCCASFIRLREDHIEFVHQSARDYLAGENGLSILDSHGRFGHEEIFLACLSYLSEYLKPNLVNLPRPDSTRDSLEGLENKPKNGILSRVDYATMFWVSHLKNTSNDSGKSQASEFLHKKLLEWLECLSLLDRLPKAIDMLRTLEEILKVDCQALAFVQDAIRFLLRHYNTLSHWPLQIYSSAVIFSPESSVVKGENLDKVPAWLGRAPPMEDSWTPMIQTLTGRLEVVRSVAFSPDGKQIASGSDSGMIKLWDTTTGSLQKTLLGDHPKRPSSSSWKHITAMAFLPDGKLILSANYDGSVMLWDTTTGDRQEMADHFGTSKVSYTYLEPPEQGGVGLHAGAFSPDCKQIAAFGDLQKILEGHSHECSALAFSADNRQLVSGSASGDCTVRLWDTTTGDLQKTFIGHTSRVLSVAMSPDCKQIASGAFDAVILWNAATGALLKTLASVCAWSVAFSPDSKHIAAGFEDGKIHIWDATGTLLKTLERHAGAVMSIAFSPDVKQLATCSTDATIKRWDNTIGGIQEALGHSRHVTSIVLSPDGKVIASGSADKTIKLWDAATGHLQKPLAGHLDTVEKVVFSPDNRQIVSCSSEAFKIWDAATGEVQTSVESDDPFTTVAVSPDGKHIASGHYNGKIKLWDTATGNLLKIVAGYRSKFDSLVTTEIFNKRLQNAIFKTQITRLVFSPDAKLILSTSTDRALKLWDAATGELLKRLPCHSDSIITEAYLSTTDYPNWIFSVAFSSDSQHIAAASADKTVRVWSIEKSFKAPKYLGRAVGGHTKSSRPWKEIKTSAQVYDVTFSAGKRYLATDIGPIALESTPTEGEGHFPGRSDSDSDSDSDSSQILCLRDQWLCYGAMPFLRLSPDFYATHWDTHGDRVVVGCNNGQVSSFNIDRRSLHAYQKTLEQ
ncbi:WD-40 repeat-containing protein [Talaromyces islandicus]|uniref:WD-40 repeat-containing protein n=1 Tax=Talaromyces islandicus TaxID=28573 RepID=A0A0U1M113_TALIS|nr:WD-40 repeat-containing protein [Talaromyces islandicus]